MASGTYWHISQCLHGFSAHLQLEALAVEKYGSMDDVKAERHKRFQKRAERAELQQEAGGEVAS